ncbi:MAG TPA: MoaD/ThiS family protein [Anaerolineae bacterium]|nr:MoaD/ThiS family protein [Anaerolineae bacterium]
MKVTVQFGAPLSRIIGERKTALTLAEGATVTDALDALRDRYPDFDAGLQGKGLRQPLDQVVYALFLNARPIPWERAAETLLRNGDRLSLFLPVAGG